MAEESEVFNEKKSTRAGRSQLTVLNPAGVVILREFDLIGGRDF
jgi:hypothetical protein